MFQLFLKLCTTCHVLKITGTFYYEMLNYTLDIPSLHFWLILPPPSDNCFLVNESISL